HTIIASVQEFGWLYLSNKSVQNMRSCGWINKGHGPYVFKVSGKIYYSIGSLGSLQGNAPSYSEPPETKWKTLKSRSSRLGSPLEYTYLGDCDWVCHYCGALFWYKERLKALPKGGAPHYHRFCSGVRVALPVQQECPEYVRL
nr:hypothetical protein [Tanacetum cinerariifolium]